MLGPVIRDRLTSPEFRPFTLVLASGERIEVRHRDSVTLASVEYRGKRIFASSLTILETKDDAVVERVVSLPLVAQVVDHHPFNAAG